MEDSIFSTIKKMLGYDPLYDPDDAFDMSIIVHINTYLGVLNDLGVGVDDFTITGDTQTWSDFLAGSSLVLSEAKSYLYLRVKQAFDPSTSSVLSSAIDKQIDELGWRMMEKVSYRGES